MITAAKPKTNVFVAIFVLDLALQGDYFTRSKMIKYVCYVLTGIGEASEMRRFANVYLLLFLVHRYMSTLLKVSCQVLV